MRSSFFTLPPYANLVHNAISCNRPSGGVQVKLVTEAGTAVLSVTDTGQGIGLEHLAHILERFYRADQAQSNSAGHTGLGLAIVRAIMESHSTDIQVASEVGQGSTFMLLIPLSGHALAR